MSKISENVRNTTALNNFCKNKIVLITKEHIINSFLFVITYLFVSSKLTK